MAKWCFLPYDFDTGIGTNNEGALAFSYELEDIDKLAGADVFNGQNSVLWKNLRQAYFDKIKQMYQELRSQGKLSYDDTERRFEEHQAVWSEAIFNEDSYFKYLAPLIDDNTSAYLSMLQGSKAEQRKWWLYNRFRYIDSKYNAGDALTDVITVRGYAKSDITVTPYADIYASVKYGSYLTQMRALRGNSYTLKCPLDNVNDTEIYIYSASQLKDIGDLSGLKIGYAEFSLATKLQAIKVGDADESYANPNLTELHLGNNTLLRKLDVRNCPNLIQTVDISGCSNVEFVYFDGTSVAGILLPTAGILKELHLPATITNLTIRNQPSLYDLTVPDYSKITTLRLENVNKVVDSKTILKAIPVNSRVRLLGIDWTAEDADDLMSLIALLDTMRGLDENGNNLDTAQVSGTISVDTVTGAQVAEIQSKYPDIKIAYQHITSFLYFYNDTGTTLLYTQSITDGADGAYSDNTPSKSSTAQYTYSFAGWSKKPGGSADSTALKAVVADRNVYAAFTATIRKYTVYFYNGSTLLQKVENVAYGGSATYTGGIPVKTGVDDPEMYEFKEWQPSGKNITGNTTCYAQYNYLGAPMISKDWDSQFTNTEKQVFTEINIVDSYMPTGEEEMSWDASYYKNGFVMAYKLGSVITIAGNGTGVIEAPVRSDNLFRRFSKVVAINGLSILNTSRVTSMYSMFGECPSLQTLDLSGFDTSKVTDMSYMFADCSSLQTLDLSGFDTSKVTNMQSMFADCSSLQTLDLSGFDTSKVTNMQSMFADCSSLQTLDLSGFDTSKVTNIYSMFRYCRSFVDLNLNNWNISSVTSCSKTFYDCRLNGKSITRDKITEWNWNIGNLTDKQIGTMFG